MDVFNKVQKKLTDDVEEKQTSDRCKSYNLVLNMGEFHSCKIMYQRSFCFKTKKRNEQVNISRS